MSAYELYKELFEETDDYKFAEVFALAWKEHNGEEIPWCYDQVEMIKEMNIEKFTEWLAIVLLEIRQIIEDEEEQ